MLYHRTVQPKCRADPYLHLSSLRYKSTRYCTGSRPRKSSVVRSSVPAFADPNLPHLPSPVVPCPLFLPSPPHDRDMHSNCAEMRSKES